MRERAFTPQSLRLITPLDAKRAVSPAFGDRVRLRSGGPIGLVVDVDQDRITFARGSFEHTFPAVCLEICN